jgi:hypothetical protein
MTLHERDPPALTLEDVKGSVWERLASLKGGGPHPFALDSPTQDEAAQLVAGEIRRITYRGSGEVLLYNIDLPAGVTLALYLDGAPKKSSHGNEAGTLRWSPGTSPLRFTGSLEIVVANTTAAGASYRVHISGV